MARTKPEVGKTVTAGEVMTSPVITVRSDVTVSEAANLMLVNQVGSVIVLDENGHFAGLFTERMLLPKEALVPFMRGKAFRVLGREVGDFENIEETMAEVRSLKLSEVMNTSARPVSRDTHIADVVERMVSDEVHHVCVVEDRKPVGIISRHDLLRLFFDPAGPADPPGKGT
ncbi:MAG: CBS domain-containing protein [Chloroflexi bacterium]|nr:CBS domain-containing protein [Chloroflexota bacterium]MDA1297493.1 CBS domain-containing protein [Chloroflexota bacterium]